MLEKEAIAKGIDIELLREEQKKLAKLVSMQDAFDFKLSSRFAGVHTEVLDKTKEILATIAVLDEDLECIEDKYAIKKIKFPYIPGYRAYRELPAILVAYDKLEEQPDLIFIEAHGIAHPRGFGLASHLGLSINKPVIGVSKNILIGKEEKDNVVLRNKVIATKIVTHEGSRPLFISVGHMISLKSAVEMVKKCIKQPHKLPEPLVQARKTADRVRQEIDL